MTADEPDPVDIERFALGLARAAGERIVAWRGRGPRVRYKGAAPPGGGAPTDPVSEADLDLEEWLRTRVAEAYPEHGFVGEETGAHHPDAETVWLADPIDGTSNFVAGYPLFACSLAVVRRGRPAIGAVWCSTSHALRPGVYHAGEAGGLCFEGEPLAPVRPLPGVERGLVDDRGGGESRLGARWDRRFGGSAALACALVAAGVLDGARLRRPHAWDVAAGIVLARAARREVWVRAQRRWSAFASFDPERLAEWRQSLVVGESAAAAELRAR
jgi:myo-inositol-1(or 4)-monophosphatase